MIIRASQVDQCPPLTQRPNSHSRRRPCGYVHVVQAGTVGNDQIVRPQAGDRGDLVVDFSDWASSATRKQMASWLQMASK